MTLGEGVVQSWDLQQCGHSWAMTDGSLLRIPVMGEIDEWQNLDDGSLEYKIHCSLVMHLYSSIFGRCWGCVINPF